MGTKNSHHLEKLETECNEFLETLIKYFTLSINRLNKELIAAHSEESANRTGNILTLFKLFSISSYFFEVNALNLGKEVVPAIEALKELYNTFSNFH